MIMVISISTDVGMLLHVSKKNGRGRWRSVKRILIMLLLLLFMACGNDVEAAGNTRIHFISLYGFTDAILLESNGHFGMVDSGEDWDYPDGSDSRYPLRSGITTTQGFEQQVIHYLQKAGVKKLDFYIATHAHSDHIGSGDEIINHFPTDRLYINEYNDSYLKETRLWDNQYVYDSIIEAARKNGTEIIMDLDREENADKRSFTMGDLQLNIMNYERDRDEAGQIVPVPNGNSDSLVVKVSAYGKNALLTSDIDPTDGDTVKIADQLIDELWADCGIEETVDAIMEEDLEFEYKVENDTYGIDMEEPKETSGNARTGFDESIPNTGKRISLDLMKMAHHCYDGNNTTYFLTSLNPRTVVITGYESWFNQRHRACLPNTSVYATASSSAAVVATFQSGGVYTAYQKLTPEWGLIDGRWYYFDENGRPCTGWKLLDGKWYYLDKKGAMLTGWQYIGGCWYYMNHSGAMQTGWQSIGGVWYYLSNSGAMQTGWQKIDGKWYYFDANGVMLNGVTETTFGWYNARGVWYYFNKNGMPVVNWQFIKGKWYYFNGIGVMQTGWQKVGGSWYYMDGSGVMQTGWQSIGGRWYYLSGSGVMQAGWQKIGGSWYYLNSSGVMVTGWQEISGSWYYFNGSGVMVTGWQFIGGHWYFMEGSGVMVTGWQKIGGKWYYLNSSGHMAVGWQNMEGYWYYMDSSGVMQTGWQKIRGVTYYLYSDGTMAVGNCTIDGKGYEFGTDGSLR